MKKLKPAHPGKLLLEEFIKPMKLTVYRVAKDSGIPQSTLAAVVSGQRSTSPETAVRLGLYFGLDAQFWLNLQTRYDLMLLDEKKSRIERKFTRCQRRRNPSGQPATTRSSCGGVGAEEERNQAATSNSLPMPASC